MQYRFAVSNRQVTLFCFFNIYSTLSTIFLKLFGLKTDFLKPLNKEGNVEGVFTFPNDNMWSCETILQRSLNYGMTRYNFYFITRGGQVVATSPQKQNIGKVNIWKWPFRAPKRSYLWRQDLLCQPTPDYQHNIYWSTVIGLPETNRLVQSRGSQWSVPTHSPSGALTRLTFRFVPVSDILRLKRKKYEWLKIMG